MQKERAGSHTSDLAKGLSQWIVARLVRWYAWQPGTSRSCTNANYDNQLFSLTIDFLKLSKRKYFLVGPPHADQMESLIKSGTLLNLLRT